MWTRVKFISVLFLLSVLLWFLPSVGGCSPSLYQITEADLMTLENHLTQLEQNNNTLKEILTASDADLTIALDALTKSQAELLTLKTQLQQAKSDAESAKASLKIANEELQKAALSFKAYEAERDKTENRLRNQRNIWEVLCFVAVGVAVAR